MKTTHLSGSYCSNTFRLVWSRMTLMLTKQPKSSFFARNCAMLLEKEKERVHKHMKTPDVRTSFNARRRRRRPAVALSSDSTSPFNASYASHILDLSLTHTSTNPRTSVFAIHYIHAIHEQTSRESHALCKRDDGPGKSHVISPRPWLPG